jgi:hypothetical protein
MTYFHHHSPENTGRSSEKNLGIFTWRVKRGCCKWPILGSHRLGVKSKFPAVQTAALASIRAIRAHI